MYRILGRRYCGSSAPPTCTTVDGEAVGVELSSQQALAAGMPRTPRGETLHLQRNLRLPAQPSASHLLLCGAQCQLDEEDLERAVLPALRKHV